MNVLSKTKRITPSSLNKKGVTWTLAGSQLERETFGTTDQVIALETKAAVQKGMNVIACIGEDLFAKDSYYADRIHAR